MSRSLTLIASLIIPIAMSVIAIGIGMFHSETAEALQYKSDFVQGGEVWRLVTAHFVHLDWVHLLLNLGGLWLVWLIVGSSFSNDQWLLLIVLMGCAITFGLGLWAPEVSWYVGLSGLLYGMLAAGLVRQARRMRSLSVLLLVTILIKTAIDGLYVPLSVTTLTNHQIVVEAHVLGIAAGMMFSVVYRLVCPEKGR